MGHCSKKFFFAKFRLIFHKRPFGVNVNVRTIFISSRMGVVSPMHDGSSHVGSSNFGSSYFGSIDFGSSNLGSSQSFQRACYGPAFPCFANKVRGRSKASSDPMGQHLLRITQSSKCVPMPLHLMRYNHPSGLRLLCRSMDCRRTAIH